MRKLISFLDSNSNIGQFLTFTSNFIATYRGLPALAGTILVTISCVLTQVIMLLIVSTTQADTVWLLLCIPGLLIHLGILLGFIGFMMAVPLGQGYGSE